MFDKIFMTAIVVFVIGLIISLTMAESSKCEWRKKAEKLIRKVLKFGVALLLIACLHSIKSIWWPM